MARLLNLILLILEIKALTITIPVHKKRMFIYYTQLSNVMAILAAIPTILLGPVAFAEVLRYTAEVMLIMTFFVTTCVLIPMGVSAKIMLFSGSGKYVHLLCPIISTISFFMFETKPEAIWILLPAGITLIYGLTMLYLNAKEKVDGPYPFFRVKHMKPRMTALWISALMAVTCVFSAFTVYRKPLQTDIKYIFVHGLTGFGSYDIQNEFVPYWGLLTGDLTRYLRDEGYDSYSASVDPYGSTWDRVCELYAQLTGTRVDYGEEHSKRCNHDRFGADFTGRALISNFENSKIVLIGHSFGGATIRLFSEIIRNGSEAEKNATAEADLSPFFKGGGGKNLLGLVTVASPTNGTTAYDLFADESYDISKVKMPEEYRTAKSGESPRKDDRILSDYADYDMFIDNAIALNETIHTFEDMYYFSIPAVSTVVNEEGQTVPDISITEGKHIRTSYLMGRYTGTTPGGFYVDESWQANDGLVNLVSARAPFGVSTYEYEENTDISPGIWYIMPTFTGEHSTIIGGLTKRANIRPMYLNLVKIFAKLNK